MGLLKEPHDIARPNTREAALPKEGGGQMNFFLLHGRWPTDAEIEEMRKRGFQS